ncbi:MULTISPECIES: TetR/AcrR family transcriptional regulator [Dermabacter]|uniref:TetR/AcrR family transcriptional regulator n=1 Tax=Dermabacter TaxID=36739 RepID=UPI00223BA6E8|nr:MULTISPECIES: TetR-like C-terminal domain-containing protein [Dermabacter]MCT1716293.1 TetR/AcrR family transcriptional regulator [Dermabacter hominis]MCT1955242.1 TetR/AcrR family transcriptional regulator [Dermabacter hominis]MCT2024715.1 TetR/AcrR family transcriptional regulator [Dermabacter hominis]MDU0937151.1 TetR-like C-terminal domain-containing protein [Dermabacter sp.]MDU1463409.1 TetR-like C-terminal domain-containing protein [Dermabacter sp.]
MSVLYAARRALSHHVEETPIDPRAQKSRESLIRVMVSALDENPQPPSVSELVRRAGASRPTFYQHFGDIPTLMHAAAMARLEGAFTVLPQQASDNPENWTRFAAESFTALFTHLSENRAFYLAVLDGPSGRAAESELTRFLAGRMLGIGTLRDALTRLTGPRAARYAEFLSAGLISQATKDLRDDLPVSAMVETTTDFLAAATGHKAA